MSSTGSIVPNNGTRSIGGAAMRPYSLRGAVAQSGAILHAIALAPEPPSIGGFSAAIPRTRGSRLRELACGKPILSHLSTMVQAAAKTQHFTRAAPAVHWRYGLAAGATGCGGDPDRAFRPGSGGLTAAAIGAVVRRKQAGAVRREFDRFCQRSCHFAAPRRGK